MPPGQSGSNPYYDASGSFWGWQPNFDRPGRPGPPMFPGASGDFFPPHWPFNNPRGGGFPHRERYHGHHTDEESADTTTDDDTNHDDETVTDPMNTANNEREDNATKDTAAGPSDEGPSSGRRHRGRHHGRRHDPRTHHHHGRGGFGGRGGRRGFGEGFGCGRGGHDGHDRRHRGPHPPPPFGFPSGGSWPFNAIPDFAEKFAEYMRGIDPEKSNEENFKPDYDLFDTTSAYVIHIELPGARKEDVAVNWDPESSRVVVSGVLHRPGDEDLLKTLTDPHGRKIGAFKRTVRLVKKDVVPSIDVEGITAKLEEGLLHIVVPKVENEFVNVRKIDIE